MIRPLVGLAAVGLALSILVHVSAALGLLQVPLAKGPWVLHLGVILLGFPTILAAQRLTGSPTNVTYVSGPNVRAALRACSPAMRLMTYGFTGYALFNFALFFLGFFGGRGDDAGNLRGFSGHWMAGYSFEMAIMAEYLRTAITIARCPNGHDVAPGANFCDVCGQAVQHVPA